MIGILIAGITLLGYVYGGYYLVLMLAHRYARPVTLVPRPEAPSVTVLITVCNEESEIRERVQNVLDCEYDLGRLEMLVASDGSTDSTDTIVSSFTDPRVKLYRPQFRMGKSETQNAALALASGEIIVFTDAGTRFARSFLREIVAPFASTTVGGVDGHLLFATADTAPPLSQAPGPMAQAQGYYWRQELRLRELESDLGILAVASGACLAVRSALLRPLPPAIGEDCVVPLDVVRSGLRMVHVVTAVAYDRMESETRREFRTRVRMTVRNWQGTWRYPELLNPLRNPRLAWALWSHKLLRWLSPFFVLLWLLSSAALLLSRSAAWAAAVPGAVFIIIALVLIAVPATRSARGWRVAWSFLVANAGFALGVTQALTGRRIVTYRQ
jgi:cellulose synthase/poly-beta-1,6-N-acetylglucosamine synthase-like glycosyltransferase